MKTIWKYPVPITDSFTLALPQGARPLAFQVQGTTPTLWCLVDPTAELVKRIFRVCGTGNPIEFDGLGRERHLGTIQLDGFVWHLFEA